MAGEIFLITESNELVEMQSSPYESESALQTLIAQFPRLLASCSDEQDNAKWLLVRKEVGVPDNENGSARWSLDHLFLDGEGVPVLVEVKRSTDTRIRREVVGQMLDYAANAVAYWPLEHIRSLYDSECERQGVNPQENLEQFLGARMDEESFWRNVKTNLQAGRIRMLFVADQIPNDLKRIIEFMNGQMDPAEVLGIEVKQFINGSLKTIAPVIVGRTSGAEARKQASSASRGAIREGLLETVEAFNLLAAGRYEATGNAANYRQIKISNFPGSMHYEFIHTKPLGITSEFHIESEKCRALSKELEAIAKEMSVLNGGQVEFDPNWSKKRGRIRVVQLDKSPAVAAKTMLDLIDATKGRIGEAFTRCVPHNSEQTQLP